MRTELGLALATFGGIMVGSCMVPLSIFVVGDGKTSGSFSLLVALVPVPWTFALFRVPNLLSVYTNIPFHSFILPFYFGAGWGIAQVLFGLAVIRIGMALPFAITIGLSAALGSLVPILLRNPEFLTTGHRAIFLLGMFLMIEGVAACSWARRRRERELLPLGIITTSALEDWVTGLLT